MARRLPASSKWLCTPAVSFLCGLALPVQGAPDASNGGSARSAANPFVVLEGEQGVWSFAKDGKPFQSLGVNYVVPREENTAGIENFYDVLPAYSGDKAAWAEATRKRLVGWGFNTAAAYCDEALYVQPMLHTRVAWFGGYIGAVDNRLIDVFSDEYARGIEKTALEQVAPHKSDPWLIGYFTNNELPFYGEHGWPTSPDRTLLDRYMELPAGSPGKQRLVAFLREKYLDAEAAAKDWEISAEDWGRLETVSRLTAKTKQARKNKDLWAGLVAERYFRLCEAAVRRHDPNHLILGCRFAGLPLRSVAEAEAPFTDVFSLNHYRTGGEPDLVMLNDLYLVTKRPLLITEYSWRATENRSGNGNHAGADVTVNTQKQRAENFATYTRAVLTTPFIVGTHWFQYFDQPTNGRKADGEDSNYGLVDIKDQPYEELVRASAKVMAEVGGTRKPANTFPNEVTMWGDRDDIHVARGNLAHPVELPLASASSFHVNSDAQRGASGTWTGAAGEAAVLDFQSGTGWGLHGDIPVPDELAGARSLTLDFTATKGVRLNVFLTESGDGAPGQQVYQGKNGADGESFELTGVVATGEPQHVIFPLDQATLRMYWGNQRGNRTIDLNGLRCVSVFIPPQQGGGKISVQRLTFDP